MDTLQSNLEQLFCPPLDSALIAAIVNDNPDFDTCYDILRSLAEEANSVFDAEGDTENELSSGNSNSNLRNSSSGEPGDGSITSVEFSIDSRSVEDELDYLSTYTTDYEDYEYSKGNAEFLKNMFPGLPEARVDTLLSENYNNVEMVVDVILNEMYLEKEQENDFSYSLPTSTFISNSDMDNSLVTEARFNHRKKKRLRKQQQKQDRTIFQNNGHRPNNSSPLSSSAPISSSSSSSTSSYWTSSSSTQSRNPWNPWNKCEFDIDDDKLCRLISIFPDHNFESVKQALINCNGEVQNAVEILNGKRQQGKVIKPTSRINEYHLHNKERDGISSNDYKTPIYDDDEIVDYEDGYEPAYCQNEVNRCYKKRDEHFKKAAKTYRRGNGGAASYHSDEGWRFDAEMKIWKLRAARSLVKEHSKKTQDEHVLDLHGCFVTEAIIIVKEWLNDWYPNATQLKPLKIITGKGNHSPNGVAKLPSAIIKFLDDDWNTTKHTGFVLVHGLKK